MGMRTAVCGRCRVGAGAGQPVPTTSGLCQNSVPPGACTCNVYAQTGPGEHSGAGAQAHGSGARAPSTRQTLAAMTAVEYILCQCRLSDAVVWQARPARQARLANACASLALARVPRTVQRQRWRACLTMDRTVSTVAIASRPHTTRFSSTALCARSYEPVCRAIMAGLQHTRNAVQLLVVQRHTHSV